jgi:hypothetical protein
MALLGLDLLKYALSAALFLDLKEQASDLYAEAGVSLGASVPSP